MSRVAVCHSLRRFLVTRSNITAIGSDGSLVLCTSEGEYRCTAAVFAIGVTEPWKPKVPGFDLVPHYAETRPPREYEGRRVAIIGKRNSGFEIANGLLPWAREVTG